MMVKKDENSKSSLVAQLTRINYHLEEKGYRCRMQCFLINNWFLRRFLTGDTMCCFDCELMPKLQHIRVAGKAFAEFEIPVGLAALWRYMGQMYTLDAFTTSCPADQDLILKNIALKLLREMK